MLLSTSLPGGWVITGKPSGCGGTDGASDASTDLAPNSVCVLAFGHSVLGSQTSSAGVPQPSPTQPNTGRRFGIPAGLRGDAHDASSRDALGDPLEGRLHHERQRLLG